MLNHPALTDAVARDHQSQLRRQAREQWAADEVDDA